MGEWKKNENDTFSLKNKRNENPNEMKNQEMFLCYLVVRDCIQIYSVPTCDDDIFHNYLIHSSGTFFVYGWQNDESNAEELRAVFTYMYLVNMWGGKGDDVISFS